MMKSLCPKCKTVYASMIQLFMRQPPDAHYVAVYKCDECGWMHQKMIDELHAKNILSEDKFAAMNTLIRRLENDHRAVEMLMRNHPEEMDRLNVVRKLIENRQKAADKIMKKTAEQLNRKLMLDI